MLTITFIRHGQSEDNLKAIWAGWKDTPLSELGREQAEALSHSTALHNPPITAIYSSPLLRAYQTALAVQSKISDIPITQDPNLREHYFGIAEGHIWTPELPSGMSLREAYAQGMFPIPQGRDGAFPEGESFNDLARRAQVAIRERLLPHLNVGADQHVAVTSHGHCISELVAAMLRLDPDMSHSTGEAYQGLLNTAWTRLEVSVKENDLPVDPASPPPLKVRITHSNQADHLRGVPADVTQNPAEEGAPAEAIAFFGGQTRQN
ncbi:phosphoglycerate mutase-like protein [Fistulina hepatica ATCC 64428]|uniref:Phosphoglycerate mutase-like protein n=1 Tax=Fistulina hepatica ATCC 64428 TaxID=1128425 RepID=A0A0D7A9Q6_9AGAR|nr:phosphoglycerate mutase-like protein [Fistulina hepatica ATCC 64428]